MPKAVKPKQIAGVPVRVGRSEGTAATISVSIPGGTLAAIGDKLRIEWAFADNSVAVTMTLGGVTLFTFPTGAGRTEAAGHVVLTVFVVAGGSCYAQVSGATDIGDWPATPLFVASIGNLTAAKTLSLNGSAATNKTLYASKEAA